MNTSSDYLRGNSPIFSEDRGQKSEYLRLINEVSCSITSILGLDELLRMVVTRIQQTFGYYYIGLSLVEDNNLVIKASAGMYSPYIHPEEISLPIGYGSCIGVCAARKKSMLVDDVRTDKNYRWFKELTESKSLIAVPLLFKGELIGVLSAESDRCAAFSESDLNLLESLSNHVSVAVVNAYTYQRAQRHAAEVTVLLEVAEDLNSQLELYLLLRRITERAMSVTHADIGLVFLFEGDCLAGHEICKSGTWQQQEWQLPLSDDRLESVINRNAPLVLDSHTNIPLPPGWNEAKPLSALFVPIRNRNGVPIGCIYLMTMNPETALLSRDVSLVTALSNQAAIAIENARIFSLEREKVEALRELEQLKSNFLSSVSHDLRTPLTALKTSSEALLELSDGEGMSKHRQLIQIINRNVERMAELVSDILEMASLQSGTLRLNYERLFLSEVLGDLFQTIFPMVEIKKQTLNLEISSDLYVMADRRRIEQVLMNLLSNAHRFTPEGGKIEVRATEQVNNILIAVSNNGPCIPKEEQKHIFEQFYRLAQSGRDRARGIGLGLSIAQSLIELHHGHIWVESPLTSNGEGAAFVFTLPKEVPVEFPNS
jgi:signal transduction histidine kinase/putative methionine-R-sulfoxide reductase with GAF domain